MAIAYAKHPLSAVDKAALVAKGYRIVDVKFKPLVLSDGDIDTTAKPKRKKKKAKAV